MRKIALLLSLLLLPFTASAGVTYCLNGVTETGACTATDTGRTSYVRVHVFGSTLATGTTVLLQQSIDSAIWYDVATITAPSTTGELWGLAPVAFTRANVTVYSGTTLFTGAGLDDGTFSGTYTGDIATTVFQAEIDGTGTPDTFKHRKSTDGGATWGTYTNTVNITGTAQALSNGVSITFTATTGHTSADIWEYTLPGITAIIEATR